MTLLPLTSDELLVVLDPGHGGEVVEIVDRRTAARPLGRPGFPAAPARHGELSEQSWTARFRGGWQLLMPNAGASCAVDGLCHGFHGAGSVARWTVGDVGPAAATLGWSGHGLVAERRIAVEGDVVRVTMSCRGAGPQAVPLVIAEHVVLGREVVVPAVALEVAGGRLIELADEEEPADVRSGGRPWPVEGLRLDAEDPALPFACVAHVDDGRASAVNAYTGVGVELTWDRTELPHLWLWRETGASDGVWRGQTELLGFEPASVPHGAGLSSAIERGEATWVTDTKPLTYTLTLRVLRGADGESGE